jgi:hypothetical protein
METTEAYRLFGALSYILVDRPVSYPHQSVSTQKSLASSRDLHIPFLHTFIYIHYYVRG